jgi:hypothetical protein
MDHMDVDQPSSSSKRRAVSPLAASSSKKLAENLLSDDEEKRIIENMKGLQGYIIYEDDKWWKKLGNVLRDFASELQRTSEKNSFISFPNLPDANDFVDKIKKKELEEWKSDVRNGIEKDDWNDLICTYISDYQIIRLHFNRDLRSFLCAI